MFASENSGLIQNAMRSAKKFTLNRVGRVLQSWITPPIVYNCGGFMHRMLVRIDIKCNYNVGV